MESKFGSRTRLKSPQTMVYVSPESSIYFLTLSKKKGLSLFGAYMLTILKEKSDICNSTSRRFPPVSVIVFLIEYSKLFLIMIATHREFVLYPWIMQLH